MKTLQPAWKIFIGGAAGVLAIWFAYGVLKFGRDTQTWGQFGDKFGALNCLFAGLGFVAIVATLTYQHHETEKKERETAALMERLERTAAALEHQARMSEQAQYLTLLTAIRDAADAKVARANTGPAAAARVKMLLAHKDIQTRKKADDELNTLLERLRKNVFPSSDGAPAAAATEPE